jgi:hypothetical protein
MPLQEIDGEQPLLVANEGRRLSPTDRFDSAL